MLCNDEIFTLLKNKEYRNYYSHVPGCERVERWQEGWRCRLVFVVIMFTERIGTL